MLINGCSIEILHFCYQRFTVEANFCIHQVLSDAARARLMIARLECC